MAMLLTVPGGPPERNVIVRGLQAAVKYRAGPPAVKKCRDRGGFIFKLTTTSYILNIFVIAKNSTNNIR